MRKAFLHVMSISSRMCFIAYRWLHPIVTNSFTQRGETSKKWLAENQKCARVWFSFFCSALMFSESDSSTWKSHIESVKRWDAVSVSSMWDSIEAHYRPHLTEHITAGWKCLRCVTYFGFQLDFGLPNFGSACLHKTAFSETRQPVILRAFMQSCFLTSSIFTFQKIRPE